MSHLQKLYPIQTGTKNPILRKKSTYLEEIDDDLREFSDVLIKLMWEYDGVGLAAPQIGKNIRMIATTQWKITKKESSLISETVMINPQIIDASQEMILSKESCLSLPGMEGTVRRYKTVQVQYVDMKGHIQTKKLKDLNAFIIQHEIDHLEGILYADKAIGEMRKLKK
jgi:peptide deformylase